MPPGGYEPGTQVHVDVFMVDTGNFQGDIAFRGVFLDFADSSPELTYPGPDGSFGTPDDNDYFWINPFEIGAVFPSLPRTSWVYPLSPLPLFMIVLPDNGSVQLGDINVVLPQSSGTYVLDVLNADDPSPQKGAEADFGFGSPNDPVTIWRAFNGDFADGTLALSVVPEPGTFLLMLVLAAGWADRTASRRVAAMERRGA